MNKERKIKIVKTLVKLLVIYILIHILIWLAITIIKSKNNEVIDFITEKLGYEEYVVDVEKATDYRIVKEKEYVIKDVYFVRVYDGELTTYLVYKQCGEWREEELENK